jgi:hypothetical protein
MSNIVQMFRSQPVPESTGRSIGEPCPNPTVVADVVASTDRLIAKAQKLSQHLATVYHAVGMLRESGLSAIHQRAARANKEVLALARHVLTIELDNLRDIRQRLSVG